jgi:outer membrane protein OmpA-like peptidoglycan-associated protein
MYQRINTNSPILILFIFSTITFCAGCATKKQIRDNITKGWIVYEGNCYKQNCGKKKAVLPWDKKKKQEEANEIKRRKADDLASQIEKAIKMGSESIPKGTETDKMLKKLINEIEVLRHNINTSAGYFDYLETVKKLAKKYCKAQMFEKIQTQKSDVDYSFKTGSSELTLFGKRDVKIFINNLRDEVATWKNDVKCDEVFDLSVFVAVVDITGYADMQGSKDPMKRKKNNMELSRQRAESVREEFLKLTRYESSIRFMVNSYGKGEKLPPGVSGNGKLDDPHRRVSIMTGIVGPKVLIDDL